MSFTQRYRLSKSIRATYYLSTHISALFTQMGKHLYVVLFPLINCDYAIFYSHPDKICVHITGIVIYAIFYSHPDKIRCLKSIGFIKNIHKRTNKYSSYLWYYRVPVSPQSPDPIRSCISDHACQFGEFTSQTSGKPISQRDIAGFNTNATVLLIFATNNHT